MKGYLKWFYFNLFQHSASSLKCFFEGFLSPVCPQISPLQIFHASKALPIIYLIRSFLSPLPVNPPRQFLNLSTNNHHIWLANALWKCCACATFYSALPCEQVGFNALSPTAVFSPFPLIICGRLKNGQIKNQFRSRVDRKKTFGNISSLDSLGWKVLAKGVDKTTSKLFALRLLPRFCRCFFPAQRSFLSFDWESKKPPN